MRRANLDNLQSHLGMEYINVFVRFEFSGCKNENCDSDVTLHFCFLQGKQRLLYNLLDALQSVTSQAVVIGVSCRLVCCFKVALIYSWLTFVVMKVNAYHYYFQIPVNNIILNKM